MSRSAKRRRRARQSRSWPDLPPELLADILGRLQLEDRARFRGVCKTWRAAERDTPCMSPMPWLLAPGRCVSLHNAAIYRVPLTNQDVHGAACRGSFDNWLALVPTSTRRSSCLQPFLLNAFTGARIQLPRWTGDPISKIILSSAPDSECCTVAAIVPKQYDVAMRRHSLIAVCRYPGQPSCRWSISTNPHKIRDIAFFNGKLYAVDGREHIFIHKGDRIKELRDKVWKNPSSSSNAPSFVGKCRLYLVPCNGRLIMVRRSFRPKQGRGNRSCPSAVYAFDDAGNSYGWVAVSSFEGHAIFVGDACCRAFTVEASSGSKIRENQICFVDEELAAIFNAGWESIGRHPVRYVLSYDVRSKCIRTYRPCEPTRAGAASVPARAWQCVAVQRLPLHRHETPPLPPRTYSEAQLRLWEVMDCLGAREQHYTTRVDPPMDAAAGRRKSVTAVVLVDIPKTTNGRHQWRFEGKRRSGHQAAEVAAHKAVTFLRSAFRNTLDDSPWSSIPHYHTHVDDKDAGEEDQPEGQGHPELNWHIMDLLEFI